MQADGETEHANCNYNGAPGVNLCPVAITRRYHAINTTGLEVRRGTPVAPAVSHVLTKILITSVLLLGVSPVACRLSQSKSCGLNRC
jgi:hypothetical protein